MEDVGEDDMNAQTEIDRYTFRSPAQATAYYYGYEKLLKLRAETELKLKERFEQKSFHDFILAQGLLPPDLLKKAVREEYIRTQMQ